MSSLTLNGDTSGSVILAAPAIAGANTVTLPTTGGTIRTTTTPGTVLQVVSNSTSSLITSSGSEVTVITQAVTPLSASSKFLITANCTYIDNTVGGRDMQLRFKRNSTVLNIDSSSSYTYYMYGGAQNQVPFNGMYLDSPATASSITYGFFLYGSSTVRVSGCQLVIMEIAA